MVDVEHHDAYSIQREILPACAQQLMGLPVVFVGVHCPLEVIMERRRVTWGANAPGTTLDGTVPQAVSMWQHAVHVPGVYDLEVDTSVRSAEECADVIRRYLDKDSPSGAFQRLAIGREKREPK